MFRHTTVSTALFVAAATLPVGSVYAQCQNLGVYRYCDDGQVFKIRPARVVAGDEEKVFHIVRDEWEKKNAGQWVIRGTQAWGPEGEICHQNRGVWSCY